HDIYYPSPTCVPATAPTALYTLSLHDALPILRGSTGHLRGEAGAGGSRLAGGRGVDAAAPGPGRTGGRPGPAGRGGGARACSRLDRKSTRLNSSHVSISYAVFCLKKKKITNAG